MVIPLYNEEVHLLARKVVASFDDLANRRVAIGREGSETYHTVRLLFKVSEVTPREMVSIDTDGALAELKAGRIDAMFFVAGYPVKQVRARPDCRGQGCPRLVTHEPSHSRSISRIAFMTGLISEPFCGLAALAVGLWRYFRTQSYCPQPLKGNSRLTDLHFGRPFFVSQSKFVATTWASRPTLSQSALR